jgi:hypothetical protein
MMRNGAAPHIDFADLAGVIEKKPTIMPSNVDFVMERKGYVLYGEFKRPEEKISEGQRITLEAMSRKREFKVFVAIGWNEGTHLVVKEITVIHNGVWLEPEACDLEGFKKRIREWFAAAEAA